MSCLRQWSAVAGLILAAPACGSNEGPSSGAGGQSETNTFDAGTTGGTQSGGAASGGSGGNGGGTGSGGDSTATQTGGSGAGTGGATQTSTSGAGTGGATQTSTSGAGTGGATLTSSTSAGTGGDAATGGSGGGTPDVCSFTIADSLSSVIPTVGVVDWGTDLPGVTEARIDFDLIDPQPGELNLGSGGPISATDSQAWLLGLKPEREYAYRITVTAGDTVCVSPDKFLTSGSIADPPVITRETGPAADSQVAGFIVTCGYGTDEAMIIDADGEIVWAVSAPASCSRAHMDWDAQYMWLMAANATTGDAAGGSDGHVVRLRMDGTGEEEIPGLERAHHDFAVLPGGSTAFLVVVDDPDTGIVERAPDGTLTTIVVLNDDSYLSGGTSTHPNALRYYERSDGYTVSDLNVSSVLHFNRQGEAVWQVDGYCSEPLEECETMQLAGTHGHQWLENGNLVVFLAGIGTGSFGEPAPVVEYSFDGSVASSNAHLEWFYRETESSVILGDVERLSNGNTLITYSDTGIIQEVTPEKNLVQSLSGSSFGYSSFRKTLYGPPQ